MRFVETLSQSVDDRLTARTKKGLHQKVANSSHHKHRGYPDETGFVPFIVVDPTHDSNYSESNICNRETSDKTTVYTACLAFPHLPISKNVRSGFSIQKLTSYACVDANKVFSNNQNEKLSVLRERERLRMNAVKTNHEFNIGEDTILTADFEEKILINAYRTAKKRVENKPTVEDVKEVIQFERNKFNRYLSFPIDEITDSMISELISKKTCSPVIPSNENQKEVLLYWIDNPNASLSEVINETGISRGRFETFRLNLPDVSCYNREYIESLSFDENNMIQKLHQYMENSTYDIYSCSICSTWSYSKMSLSAHKRNSNNHKDNFVTVEEHPTSNKVDDDTDVVWDKNITVEEMMTKFDTVNSDTDVASNTEDTEESIESLSELLNKSETPAISVISNALGETEGETLNRLTKALTDSEKSSVKSELSA